MESIPSAPLGDGIDDTLKLPAPPRVHCHFDCFSSRRTVRNVHLSSFVRTFRSFVRQVRSCSTEQDLTPALEVVVSFSAD